MSTPVFAFQWDIVPKGTLTVEAINDAAALTTLRTHLLAIHGDVPVKIVKMSVESDVSYEQRYMDGRVALQTLKSVYEFTYEFAIPEVPE